MKYRETAKCIEYRKLTQDFPKISGMARIYAMVDPRTEKPFYVGATDDIVNRYRYHVCTAKNETSKNKKLGKIIRSILSEGLLPSIDLLEYTGEANSFQKERYWIDFFTHVTGYTLVNSPNHANYQRTGRPLGSKNEK